ncbi:tRNA uridine 5-carboxymethylaminomethyl modification protein GidA [Spiroplasma sp. TIUS-1]|uniref:tRNA uridine-5-carboxymethylaminomethyl(34) synthesis enzyme MnmG n=1 Tax=Spiroplasma sp. TIUS-1 TaxID=216963 RepID=UPI0013979E57|nr:tRNA uridine-5-carboxymethylaminomethyl(34) synthesis enzyme MnmG [Spiroplasma sp. TIUS-1]QHX36231.1 tRNA uridine 5-carboxymethylaminomethyl modification protein GidA [Spiroplasma sp. TIUS-1]
MLKEIKKVDIVVIGAGHAGVEAALASARMGCKTILLNLYKDRIAAMPCNPSIGGPAKGVVVREIDAIGGEMGKAADATSLQMKLLNSSRGPGVWALRAQSDKVKYSKYMQNKVENQENLELVVGIAKDLILKDSKIVGVLLMDGRVIECNSAVLTTGTYLSSILHRGSETEKSGPDGEITTNYLSDTLRKKGIKLLRFKTGTPPRVRADSIDFSKATMEPGTDANLAFSFSTKTYTPVKNQIPCHLIYTTKETKSIIEDNLKKSAMYGGTIDGIGPRYCPSFEDKVVRFSSKEQHQIFLEPESLSMDTIYVQGFSTSMPIDIQDKMLRSLPGFENVIVDKWAYAIEYDCIDPTQLKLSLELKGIDNLFLAGQINGTSGYEEAAGQGLIAGINAVRKIQNKEPFIPKRSESYIGLMIDDLVNKGVVEPYRLLTSRSEYRLTLRNDNAEFRLKKYGRDIGLIKDQEWNEFLKFEKEINEGIELLKSIRFTPKMEIAVELNNLGQSNITQGISAYQLLKQPTVDSKIVFKYIPQLNNLSHNQLQYIVINIRFEGYIKKELETIQRFEKSESKIIPADIVYNDVENLATEARQLFEKIRPTSVGQASRITGINPADIQMLLFYLRKKYAQKTTI